MSQMTVRGTLPTLLCLAIYADAQAPQTFKTPTSAERREMLARLRADLDEYTQHMPALVCTLPWKLEDSDPPEGSHDPGGIVVVDLKMPWRGSTDENKASFAVEPLIRELATSDAKLVFERWATLRRKPTALYRYKGKAKGGIRQAEIYADRGSGTASRIVFEGLDTPQHIPIFCRTAHE